MSSIRPGVNKGSAKSQTQRYEVRTGTKLYLDSSDLCLEKASSAERYDIRVLETIHW